MSYKKNPKWTFHAAGSGVEPGSACGGYDSNLVRQTFNEITTLPRL